MTKNQNIKCSACGASSATRNNATDLLECQYCGSMMSHSGQAPVKQSKTKLTVIMISLPLIVVALMVVFWVAFKNMRVHTSVEQYYPTEKGQVVHGKEVDPLAKPFMSEEFKSLNNTSDTQVENISWADNLSINSHVKGQTSQGGLYWIFGVENVGEEVLNRPGVVVSLFDEEGRRIAEQSGWAALTSLKSGGQTEVLVFLSEPPESIASFEINTLASKPNQFNSPPVPLEVKTFTVNERNDAFELIGDVQNSSATAVKYSRIYAVARNNAGEPIGMGNAFATQKDLNAGEISGFKLRVGAFLTGQPSEWTLWAHGRQ